MYVIANDASRSPFDRNVYRKLAVFICNSRNEAWKLRAQLNKHVDFSSVRVVQTMPFELEPTVGEHKVGETIVCVRPADSIKADQSNQPISDQDYKELFNE